MFCPIFRTIYKKKEAKICLLFCAFPLLLIVTSLLPSNFMQLSGAVESMSCVEFFDAVISVQFQLTLPSVAFMHLVTTCVHDEIKKGNLYLYKDIPKTKIFRYKSYALLLWYMVYFVCTFLTSVFTYYVYVIRQSYASGTFFPSNMDDMRYAIISVLSIVVAFGISLLLVVVLSVFLGNGISLVIGILFVLFCQIAPSLEKINIFFPTGFLNIYNTIGFCKTIAIVLLITTLYVCVIGALGRYKIKKIEF